MSLKGYKIPKIPMEERLRIQKEKLEEQILEFEILEKCTVDMERKIKAKKKDEKIEMAQKRERDEKIAKVQKERIEAYRKEKERKQKIEIAQKKERDEKIAKAQKERIEAYRREKERKERETASMDRPGNYSCLAMRMMESMGHKPGSGLGKKGQGIIEPLKPFKVKNRCGLGYH